MTKKMIIGISIGAVFMYLTLRNIDLSACWVYMRQANLLILAVCMLAYIVGFIVRAVRWKSLLGALVAKTPLARIFSLLILGFFMNNTLPFRLGELVRVQVSGKKLKIPRSSVLATMVVERLFDGLSFVVMFLMVIAVLPFPDWARKSFIAASTLFIGGIVCLFFLVRHQSIAVKWFNKMPLHIPLVERLKNAGINFIAGLHMFTNTVLLIKVALLSIVVWSIEGMVFMVTGYAFGIHITIFQAFFVMLLIATGTLLPPAPGYIGTIEFLGVTGLTLLGIDKNRAFGFVFTFHMLQLLTIACLGVRSLITEKIAFKELFHFKNQ